MESAGTELATGRTIETVWLRVIAAFRKKIARVLERLYEEVLEMNGFESTKVRIIWPPLREPMGKAEIASTLITMYQMGALRDVQELRKLLSKNGILDLEDLPPEEFETPMMPGEEQGAMPAPQPASPGEEEMLPVAMIGPDQMENIDTEDYSIEMKPTRHVDESKLPIIVDKPEDPVKEGVTKIVNKLANKNPEKGTKHQVGRKKTVREI